MAVTGAARLVLPFVLLAALVAYLRDPPWLANVTSGLSDPEQDPSGEYRWTGGRASFFVPSDARSIRLSLRAMKDTPTDWPINVTITLDDRTVELVRLADETWHDLRLRLPPAGSRRVRRVDLKLDRLRSGRRGVQLRGPTVD